MHGAGFVLVGGRSSRMGVDKAMLPHGDGTLAGHVAKEVLSACGSVTLVGDRTRYESLGFRVIADRVAGNGPLGGIAAAVNDCKEWALVVACDMPEVQADFLRTLLEAAAGARPGTECVVPESDNGLEPLCAVYHRRALPLLDAFIDHKFLKMQDVVGSLQMLALPAPGARWARNLNSPEDLRA